MNKLTQRSLYNALGTIAYISIVVTIMTNVEKYFSDKPDNFLMPIAFLTILVTSATITGGLVLGKPILMYLDGQKKEAVKLLLYTIGWMAIAVVLTFAVALSV